MEQLLDLIALADDPGMSAKEKEAILIVAAYRRAERKVKRDEAQFALAKSGRPCRAWCRDARRRDLGHGSTPGLTCEGERFESSSVRPLYTKWSCKSLKK